MPAMISAQSTTSVYTRHSPARSLKEHAKNLLRAIKSIAPSWGKIANRLSRSTMRDPAPGAVAEGFLSRSGNATNQNQPRTDRSRNTSQLYTKTMGKVHAIDIEGNVRKITLEISQKEFFTRLARLESQNNSNHMTQELRLVFKEFGDENMRFIAKPVSNENSNELMSFTFTKEQPYKSANHMQFHAHLENLKAYEVGVFKNVGGDATLICPKIPDAVNTNSPYYQSHRSVGSFARSEYISNEKFNRLFVTLAKQVQSQRQNNPNQTLYVNTHGAGVPWLHLRIDTTDKYIPSVAK